MDQFITALTNLMTEHALASMYVNIELGEFRIYRSSALGVYTLEEELETSGIPLDEVDLPADPKKTMQIAPDAGGMSSLGVCWMDGRVSLVVVELEDPIPENLIQRFTTPAAFLTFLDRRDDLGDRVKPEIRALLTGA